MTGLDTYSIYHIALTLAHDCVAIANQGSTCLDCAWGKPIQMKAINYTDYLKNDSGAINRTEIVAPKLKERLLQKSARKYQRSVPTVTEKIKTGESECRTANWDIL